MRAALLFSLKLEKPVRTLRLAAIAVALATCTSTAWADDPETTSLRMTGVNGRSSNGVYVGPYQAVLGSVPGTPAIDIFCVDYLNHSYIGQTETAVMTNLSGNSDLSHTRIGSSTSLIINGTGYSALDRYRMAALLTDQFALTASTTPPAQLSQEWGNIHRAIWNITAGPNSGVPSAGSDGWVAWVTNWYNSNGADYDWSRYIVLSDATMRPGAPMLGGMQEFITTTPEPEALLLMGTGLLVLLGFARTRGNA
jgi:hypothetical protein